VKRGMSEKRNEWKEEWAKRGMSEKRNERKEEWAKRGMSEKWYALFLIEIAQLIVEKFPDFLEWLIKDQLNWKEFFAFLCIKKAKNVSKMPWV
jgi:hypothetical protein